MCGDSRSNPKDCFLTRVNGREKGTALRPVNECNTRQSGSATLSKPLLLFRHPLHQLMHQLIGVGIMHSASLFDGFAQ